MDKIYHRLVSLLATTQRLMHSRLVKFHAALSRELGSLMLAGFSSTRKLVGQFSAMEERSSSQIRVLLLAGPAEPSYHSSNRSIAPSLVSYFS
jgi:hypothetical protein